MTSEIKLKPCPFCGQEVKWHNGAIYCWHCDLNFRADPNKTLNEKAWNRRVKEKKYEYIFVGI